MAIWIDFKRLRESLDFEAVLGHYSVEIKRKGDQHHGFCPLPNHQGHKNSPSFSANLKKGIFHCFGCGAKGNVLEFAAIMENAASGDGGAFRKVALELQTKFCPHLGIAPKQETKTAEKKPEKNELTKKVPAVVNAPLDFELKGLNREHPYLLGRGFSQATIDYFGLGFCSRGMLRDRVVIPLHDQKGRLIGYAGRVIDEAAVMEDNPRYRFPGKREREGKVFEFRKTRFLYNGFRIKAPVDDLIVVEGFTSVWWLSQNGFPHVVATMGAECSERQAEIIVSLVKPSGRAWIMLDGDDAGRRGAQSFLLHVSPHRFVRWVKPNEDCQPTDLSGEQLKICFTP